MSEQSKKRPQVISFINYKGGVAKTTSTYHIGCWLAYQYSKRVLLIDIDPQANLTFLCANIGHWEEQRTLVGTISDIYENYNSYRALNTRDLIWKEPIQYGRRSRLKNLDLIPCDLELLGEDIGGTYQFRNESIAMQAAKAYLRERNFLSSIIGEVGDDYDYVLIDCPPNLYVMTHNALATSDYYIVTAIPDHLSTIGLNILKRKVERIGERICEAMNIVNDQEFDLSIAKLGGVLFVRVRQSETRVIYAHQQTMDAIRGNDEFRCFDTITTELVGYTEAARASVPIWFVHTNNARRANEYGPYPRVVEEILERF